MNAGSLTDRLLRFCNLLVGRFRGGLGHINIAQSVIFAGMSGSAIADLAGTGRIDRALAEMLAQAVVAAHERAPVVDAGPCIAALREYVGIAPAGDAGEEQEP